MFVWKPASVVACMYGETYFAGFSFYRTAFLGRIVSCIAIRGRIGWISYQVIIYCLLFMTLTYHCLCLGSWRSDNRRIYCCSSIGGHRTYIHCMRIAKAVLMWCMECICILSFMRISYRVGVCMCGEGFYFHFSLSPLKSLFVHFSISPLGQVISPLLCANHVCVYVLLCVCMYVWWGSSLSLDRRGDVCMVVVWLYSRG
jgi:hypothetical protein